MTRTPTEAVLDQAPPWSIFDVARPITELPGIAGEEDWVAGLNLAYRSDAVQRERMATHLAVSDALIASIADPSVWAPAASAFTSTKLSWVVDATGGTYTITVNGQTTAAIAHSAAAATVQTALETLSSVAVGDVAVSGGPGATAALVAVFGGALAATAVAFSTDPALLTGGAGTAAVTTITAGGEGGTYHLAPTGFKAFAADPDEAGYRPFFVYVDQLAYELYQQLRDAEADADAVLRAHLAWQLSAELCDSLFTKNPGLSLIVARLATDVSAAGPTAVAPSVAISTLYEAYRGGGTGGQEAGSGPVVLHVPYHAVPFLVRDRLVEWRDGRLVDCYGSPVHPMAVNQGPLTDPDDLETAEAAGDGEGYIYLSPTIYVGVAEPRRRLENNGFTRRGVYAKGNEEIGFAEVAAIVVCPPQRTYSCLAALNEAV